MPNGKRTGIKNGGLVAAAAAVPILLAVTSGNTSRVSSNAVIPTEITATSCTSDIKTIQDCHDTFPAGCSSSARPNYDAYLNVMKDQVADPESLKQPLNLDVNDFNDLDARTPPQLSTHNHAEFADALNEMGEGAVRSVVAYLYFSKANPGESSNCQLKNVKDGDFHVLIGFDDKVAAAVKAERGKATLSPETKTQVDHAAIIVEMTPFVRQSQGHTGWDLGVLKKHWGDQVKVVGQLMVDNEHNLQSANCALVLPDNLGASKCWRKTVWEIHPVMQFFFCNKGDCTADSDSGWLALDNAQ